MLTLCRWRDW